MIVVMILESVPVGVRGDLSRYLLQPRAGVFVGSLSPTVRDRLWERVSSKRGVGSCLLIFEDPRCEQRVSFRQVGERAAQLVDFDGLTLLRVPHPLIEAA